MKRILLGAALCGCGTIAQAQSIVQWQLTTGSPPALQARDRTGQWGTIALLPGSGVFTPNLSTPGPIGLTTPNSGSFSAVNVAYLNTFAPGARGPAFLWSNCGAATLAGQNCLLQGWVGTLPTGTPQANNPVAVTFAMTNGNNRFLLGTMNLIGQLCGPAEGCVSGGYNDTPINPLEVDLTNSATVGWESRNRSFNATTGTFSKVALTMVSSPAVGRVTSYGFGWSAEATGAGWAYTGIELSRVLDFGYGCIVDPNGTVDSGVAFSDSCVRDNSKSASFAKFGNFTHSGALIDISAGASFAGFVKGLSAASTIVRFYNSADFNNIIKIDSGITTDQSSIVRFSSKNVDKWDIIKPSANTLSVFNAVTGNSAVTFNVDDSVTFKSGITIGSTTLLTTSVALTDNAAASVGTLTNAPAAGNPTKWIAINDNGTIRKIPTWQ